MSQRRLFVGLDLRNDITQIGVLDPMKHEPEMLESGGKTSFPTRLRVPGTKEYMEGFVEKIFCGEPVLAAGNESDPVNVLAAYFRKILSLTRKRYPNEAIRQLVVTTPYQERHFIDLVYQALSKIGVEKDRAMVIDRRKSFIYYIMSQKKELWVNYVGMFDYNDQSLTYLQMQTDRMRRPMLVAVEERDYSEYIEMFQAENNTEEEKQTVFESMVHGAIHGKIVTTLYMTGAKFAHGFADEAMKKLCVGRHLFKGDNLYVSGACYCARELTQERKLDDFVYLDEDSIGSTLSMSVYADGKNQEILLARAGTPWYQIEREIELIPDGDEDLEISIENVLTKDRKVEHIPMEGILGKTDRKARIGVRLRFADKYKCIVTVKDKGFGQLFPSSCRIWERTLGIE